MRPWRGGGRSGCGLAVLFAGPRNSRTRSAASLDSRFPGRCLVGHRERRSARKSARRGQPGPQRGGGMTAPAKILPAFNVEKARADFPILAREVYGKPLVYLDS